MKFKEVQTLIRNICLSLLFFLCASNISADPINSSISIDFLTPQAGQEEINILQTNLGLMSFRRNLEAIYISHPVEIPIENAYPFLTFTPVGDLDNYRKEGFSFFVRFSPEGDTWSSWEELPLFHEIKPEDTRYIGEMMYLDSTQHFLEYMFVLNNDDITLPPIRIKNLRLDFFNPNSERIPEFQEGGEEDVAIHLFSEDTSCDCPQPDFSDRVAWNCPDGNVFSGAGSPVMTTVTHMIVHHSAGPNSSSNYGAAVLSIWNLHKNTNGWDDIGYNWLIDPNGIIYEGRGGGNNVRGAHFCGKNTGTMGICFLGNFETATPTPAALSSLEALTAWKSCDSGLDPMGTSLHASSAQTLSVISGHQDGCNTLCPGANLYPKLESRVRPNADSILQACTSITSVDDLEDISDFNLYPNPNQGKLNLAWFGKSVSQFSLRLINLQGQSIVANDFQSFFGEQNLELNLTHVPAGIYFLHLSSPKGKLSRKVIME